jgi:hypothetical protein
MKKFGLAVLIAALLALPMSALALEKMSGSDLGGVVGQAGVTLAFGSTTTTTISFSQVNWGDPDGLSGTCSTDAGWIIIDGDIIIDQAIGCGEQLTLDIATNGSGGTCTIGCVDIPDGITFIAVGLPTTTLDVTVPATLTIGLGDAAGNITGTLGILNLQSLSVDAGTPSALYIWAHP